MPKKQMEIDVGCDGDGGATYSWTETSGDILVTESSELDFKLKGNDSWSTPSIAITNSGGTDVKSQFSPSVQGKTLTITDNDNVADTYSYQLFYTCGGKQMKSDPRIYNRN